MRRDTEIHCSKTEQVCIVGYGTSKAGGQHPVCQTVTGRIYGLDGTAFAAILGDDTDELMSQYC